MKIILLLTLLSVYFCKYCDDTYDVSGYDDCKNLEIQDNSNGDKYCCYAYQKIKDDNGEFEEESTCISLNEEGEKMMIKEAEEAKEEGIEGDYKLICREETGDNEDSSSIKNLTFKDKNYLCIFLFLTASE